MSQRDQLHRIFPNISLRISWHPTVAMQRSGAVSVSKMSSTIALSHLYSIMFIKAAVRRDAPVVQRRIDILSDIRRNVEREGIPAPASPP